MMKLYRRRPVEVRAVQWVVRHTPSDDAKPIVDFINKNGGRAWFVYDPEGNDNGIAMAPKIMIETLEGPMAVRPGFYVCRGLEGEFWGVKPSIFEATNEAVAEDGTTHSLTKAD